MTTANKAIEALGAIKETYRTPGCCFMLSKATKGELCDCVLCLCDRLITIIDKRDSQERSSR